MKFDGDIREACLVGFLATPIGEFCVVTAVDSGYLKSHAIFYALMCIAPLAIGAWVFRRNDMILAAALSSVVATTLLWVFIIRPREWSAYGYLFSWPLIMAIFVACIAIGGFVTRAFVARAGGGRAGGGRAF